LVSNNFDGMRLVFASMVVLFHVGLLSEAPALAWLRLISATFAVQAFFFVSGFLVVMSYDRSSALTGYFKKRFLRIAPAYCVVVIGAAVLLAGMSDLPASAYFTSPDWRSYVVSNLLLSNFAHPWLPGVFADNVEQAVNGSLWTIKVEVMFYITVPFIVWAVRRFGYRPALATIFVASILWYAGFTLAAHLGGGDLAERLAKQLPGQLGFFAGGALAYYRTREGLSPPPAWAAGAGALVYLVTDGPVGQALAPVCVTLIAYWAAIGVRQLWSAHRIGDISYGIYLYHFPIAQTLIALGVFAVAPVAGVAAVVASTLMLAFLSWHLVEKRALRLAHRGNRSSGANR
jgi:peptidoglycan/LPS O-acetylase OafA/YrhL